MLIKHSKRLLRLLLQLCCSSEDRSYVWCVDLSAFMTSMCVQRLCGAFSRWVTVSWRSFCHSWCRSDATLRCNLMILSLKGHLPWLNNDQMGLYHILIWLYSHGHSFSWGRLCSGQLSDQTHAFGFILTHFLLLLLLLRPCNRQVEFAHLTSLLLFYVLFIFLMHSLSWWPSTFHKFYSA